MNRYRPSPPAQTSDTGPGRFNVLRSPANRTGLMASSRDGGCQTLGALGARPFLSGPGPTGPFPLGTTGSLTAGTSSSPGGLLLATTVVLESFTHRKYTAADPPAPRSRKASRPTTRSSPFFDLPLPRPPRGRSS